MLCKEEGPSFLTKEETGFEVKNLWFQDTFAGFSLKKKNVFHSCELYGKKTNQFIIHYYLLDIVFI